MLNIRSAFFIRKAKLKPVKVFKLIVIFTIQSFKNIICDTNKRKREHK
jgi:hypothetical protein